MCACVCVCVCACVCVCMHEDAVCVFLQLCRLIKDCGLHHHGSNVLELIGTVQLELGSALDHTSSLLMREFLQLLVHVACKIYGGDAYQR